VAKFSLVGLVTDDTMAHAHCMLDNKGNKRTFKIRNTFCFFPATTVARTRLNVTLYVLCLPCYCIKYTYSFKHHTVLSSCAFTCTLQVSALSQAIISNVNKKSYRRYYKIKSQGPLVYSNSFLIILKQRI
jgi:hypothetical protein